MRTFEKVGMILAWILSIVLVLTLTVAPMMLSALSLLNANIITKAVTDTLTQSLSLASQDDTAADYSVTKLSNTSEAPDTNGASGVLEGILGDQVSPEILDELLSSKAAQEFIKAYTGDVVNAFTGSGKAPRLDAEKVKSIVKNNMDEIVDIVRELNPDLSDSDIAQLKDSITKAVDEQAQQLVQALPEPEEIKQGLMESSPELRTAFDILAAKNAIKLAVIGVIVLLSGLIFVCRLWGLRGFRWLAVDLFVGGGMNGLISVGLLLGSSAVKQMIAGEPTIGGLVSSLLSSFTTGMLVRTAVMLIAGGAMLTVYILIKKAQNADKCDMIVPAGE